LTFLTWNATGTLAILVAPAATGGAKPRVTVAAALAAASNDERLQMRKTILTTTPLLAQFDYLPMGR
jgi:hypothetical protein